MENGGASNFALCPRVILFSFFFQSKKKNLKIIESTVRFEFIRVSNSNNYLLIQENNRDEQFSKKKKKYTRVHHYSEIIVEKKLKSNLEFKSCCERGVREGVGWPRHSFPGWREITRAKRMETVCARESWRALFRNRVAKLQKFREGGTDREIASPVIDCSITFSASACRVAPANESPFLLSPFFTPSPLFSAGAYALLFFFSPPPPPISRLDTQMRPDRKMVRIEMHFACSRSLYVGVRGPDEIRKRREGGKEGGRGRKRALE